MLPEEHDARAKGERIVGIETTIARPQRSIARFVERICIRIRTVTLCRMIASVLSEALQRA